MIPWFQILAAIVVPLLVLFIGLYVRWLWKVDSVQDRGVVLRDEFVGRQFGEGGALFEIHSVSTEPIPSETGPEKLKMWSPWHRELNGWTIVTIHSHKIHFTEMWEYMDSSDFFEEKNPIVKYEGTKYINDFQTSSEIWVKSVNSKDIRMSLEEVSSYLRYVLDNIPLDAAKRQPF